jgi:hypothetical protein
MLLLDGKFQPLNLKVEIIVYTYISIVPTTSFEITLYERPLLEKYFPKAYTPES